MRDQILVALSKQRLGLFWANETGAAFRDADMIHYGLPGSPDILGCVSGGYWIGLEVKTGNGKLRLTQMNFKTSVEKWGGAFFVVRSVDDAIAAVAKVANGRIT